MLLLLSISLRLLSGTACAEPATDPAPASPLNVVLVVVDTLRADHVGVYGARRPTTPALDRLAGEGVFFRRAYSPSPWTKPATASILTGLYPGGHGAIAVRAPLSWEADTLAEILKKAGYTTLGVISGRLLMSKYGISQGFRRYDEKPAKGGASAVTSEMVTRHALDLVEEQRRAGEPLFLFVHYFDPHYSYNRHEGVGFAPAGAGRLKGSEEIHELRQMAADMSAEEIDFLLASYDEEIRFTDSAIQALVDGLKEAGVDRSNSLFVITADHGEGFMERGWIGHTRFLYEEFLRVPLIMLAPGGRIPPGRAVSSPVTTVSVTPTILGFLGLKTGGTPFQAPSLAPFASGGEDREAGYLLSEVDFDPFLPDNTVKISHKKTLIGPRFKLIRDDPTSTFQLYDLEADPKEERDLAPREPGKVKELAALLKERLARNRAAAPSPEKVRLNDEQIKILRSLGYVGREEKHPPGKGRKKKK